MNSNPNNLPQHSDDKKPARVVRFSEHFSGPLPHPSILEKYDQIVPGAAERILQKFENQTDHRQKLETIVVRTDSWRSIGGLVCGFIITMVTIIGGIYTALQGSIFLGGSLSFAGLALLVGAFLTNWRSKELAKKQR